MDEHFDLIVIGGGGSGGEAARRAIREHGASVAVIERKRWGGECGTVACKPTKQYATAADLLHDLRSVGADLGIETASIEFNLATLNARKNWLTGGAERWRMRYGTEGMTQIDGGATIVDAGTVRVGDRVLIAERILVATGSRVAVPPVAGLDEIAWLDNEAALALTRAPESMLVIGAGAVGLEFGQMFSRFGSRVTIATSGPSIAGRADGEAAASLAESLRAEGIEVITSTTVRAVVKRDGMIVAELDVDGEARELVVSDVLVASGRRPNVEGIGLEEVGVELAPQGIVVDAMQRTSVPGIWAVGDVVASPQLTPVGAYEGQVAVSDMFGNGIRTTDLKVVPWAIFTDPEITGAGLTEEDAIARGFEVETSVLPAANLLRPSYTAPRDAEVHGLIKLVYERGSHRVLGMHAVLRGAAEFIQGFATAISLGVTIEDLAYGHYAFPTAAEGVHYAAEAVLVRNGAGVTGRR
ncbi:MAG: NAD(P)/FAD-dependent oxidoreductase [Gaiellales bacterium]